MRLGLFIPCFVDAFHPSVGIATVRILEHLGFRPEYPEDQTCCGQAHFNAGDRDEATRIAKHFCEVFAPYDVVVCPSGSCTAMVRCNYPELVDSKVSSRVFELCEFLVNRAGVTEFGATLHGKAALHVGCHARRSLKTGSAVRALLGSVKDLSVLELSSDAWCCGFGGTFSVKFPEISSAMGKRKLGPILDSGADYFISTESSCHLHLGGLLSRQGHDHPKLLHIAEVLASGLEDA